MIFLTINRHSKSMIEKLRSAGLGFYVKEADTKEKLGTYRATTACGFSQSAYDYSQQVRSH